MKQQGFAGIFIILAVLAVLVGGVYYYQTHKETFEEKLSRQNPMVYFTPPGGPTNPSATSLPSTR